MRCRYSMTRSTRQRRMAAVTKVHRSPAKSIQGTWAQAPLCLLFACLLLSEGKEQETHNPLEKINVSATRTLLDNQIILDVNSTALEHTGQWFTVTWSNVPNPSYGDWIGLMVPAGADMSATAPAKYKIAASSPTHIRTGSGSLKFRLINYRHDMQFVFLRGGLMTPVAAALSPVIKVLNPNEPLHGHLALTGDNMEMSVQWVTLNSQNPVVRWGTEPGVYPYTTPATSQGLYTRGEMCGPPANSIGWVEPGTRHTAVLQGLEPGRRYYYVYGSEESGFSAEASFRAPPAVGPKTRVKFLAVADLGQSEVDGSMEVSEMNPSLNTTRLMVEEAGEAGEVEVGLLLHNGDISYARGYVTQWDNFMHQLEPLTRRVPYMVSPGNHERDWPGTGDRFPTGVEDSGGECGVAYERRLGMPLKEAGNQWYSFDFGPIHFLQYSTEQPFEPGSPQHDFIKSDLASVDRRRTPWLIVGGHRPMYISSTNVMMPDGDQPVTAELRAALEDLFMEYKVDMTWHGHHHSYQRTCPVYKGKCLGYDSSSSSSGSSSSSSDSGSSYSGSSIKHSTSSSSTSSSGSGVAAAPVHVVIGHGGADLSLNVELWPSHIWESIKLWWGYLRVEASGTELKCEAISDLDGSVMDSITLLKPEGWGEGWMEQRQEQQQQQEEEERLEQQ